MAGSTIQTYYNLGTIKKITLDCTSEPVLGAEFLDAELTQKIEGFLLALETNPGTPAPTDLYDITIEDAEGLDVLQGVGTNRATATTESVAIVYATNYKHPCVTLDDTLTLKIANNSTGDAITKVILYYSAVD